MKIVALIGSFRKNGNSTLAAKYIAQELDADLEILRLTDYKIKPCKACYACLLGDKCKIDDDVYHIYEKIKESDKILISSPVYVFDATGPLKTLLDRQLMAIDYFEEFSEKDAAVITSHGFENMKGWAASTHLALARVIGLNVVGNVEVNAALPGEVLAEDENKAKLDRIVKGLEEEEVVRFDGQCPICLNTSFRVDEVINCMICGSKFDQSMNLIEEGERLQENWFEDHFGELKKLKEEYVNRIDELNEAVEEVLEESD